MKPKPASERDVIRAAARIALHDNGTMAGSMPEAIEQEYHDEKRAEDVETVIGWLIEASPLSHYVRETERIIVASYRRHFDKHPKADSRRHARKVLGMEEYP